MKLDILTVAILLLLTQCGYFRPVNGQSSPKFISTSPPIETSSNFDSMDESQNFSTVQSSSLETTEMSTEISTEMSTEMSTEISTEMSTEISPSSNIDIISTSTIASQYTLSPSFSASNTASFNVTAFPVMSYSDLSTFPVMSSSDLSDMNTSSNIINPSSDVLSIASTSFMFSSSFSFNDTSITSISSDTSSTDISPTKTIVTDFSTSHLVTTDSTLTDSTLRDMTTDTSPLTVSTLRDMTTDTSPEGHTSKSPMSKSSKIAAGICIPLAIIAILGLTYYFYRRKRQQNRNVKFTSGQSTWSYANASFADDAVKSSTQ